MYILGYGLRENQTFDVKVFVLDLENGEISERLCINYPVPPLSFVKAEKFVYIGMGNKAVQHKNNGMLLKASIE